MKGLKRFKLKKRNQFLLAGLMVLVLLLGFYLNTQPLYIGFVGGLSGHWSQLGVQARDGFLLAVDDINASGGIKGRKLVPIVLDDRNDNDYSHYLLEELRAKEVDFVIGFTVSAMAPSIKAYGQNEDILFISPTMSTNELTGIDDHFIRVCNPNQLEAYALLESFRNEEIERLAILYDLSNQPYTEPIKIMIEEKISELGGQVVYTEGFHSKNVYFEEIVKRVEDSKPTEILLLTSAMDTAEIAQHLKSVGSDAVVYASAWARTNDLLGFGGKALENMRLVGLSDIESKSPDYLKFKDDLYKQYNSEANFPQMYGYEAMILLKEGITSANSMQPSKVKEAIIKLGHFNGLQEKVEIDIYGDANRSFYMYVIRDGQYHYLK